MPRSTTTATLESTTEGSVRSWKQIRTRGLSATAQSTSQLPSGGSESDWIAPDSEYGDDINIDLGK